MHADNPACSDQHLPAILVPGASLVPGLCDACHTPLPVLPPVSTGPWWSPAFSPPSSAGASAFTARPFIWPSSTSCTAGRRHSSPRPRPSITCSAPPSSPSRPRPSSAWARARCISAEPRFSPPPPWAWRWPRRPGSSMPRTWSWHSGGPQPARRRSPRRSRCGSIAAAASPSAWRSMARAQPASPSPPHSSNWAPPMGS